MSFYFHDIAYHQMIINITFKCNGNCKKTDLGEKRSLNSQAIENEGRGHGPVDHYCWGGWDFILDVGRLPRYVAA